MKYRIRYKIGQTWFFSGYMDNKEDAEKQLKGYNNVYDECEIIESEG